MYHSMSTETEFARVVDELFENVDALSDEDQASVRLSKRSLDIERKLPEDFISELSRTSAQSYSAWVKARPENDFGAVRPFLEKLFELARRRSDLLGYEEHPYDPLLDAHDAGLKTSIVKPLLSRLGEELSALLPEITKRCGDLSEVKGHFDQPAQNRLCRKVVEDIGFCFDSGRLDIAPHPFITSLGQGDFRITTRYNESDFTMALYGCIHETGHALFEMGLPPDYNKHPPMGAFLSLSVHESQSRLWENLVGRSREFSVYLSRVVTEFFPQTADSLTPDKLWQYANHVRPSLIRTEADEVTYSLHVVIRMLLEERIVTRALSVADLPDAWNDLYERYLGIRPTDFKNGVMQDTHWYGGSVGYFPTYAVGNLLNAMMMESAREALPHLPSEIEAGEFAPLLGWLRENVHRCGMRYSSPDLIRRITGRELSVEPFVRYIKGKFLG